MITTVMFDMGGTLEDICVDEASKQAANRQLYNILLDCGMAADTDPAVLRQQTEKGWIDYGCYRDSVDVELKPEHIWCDYVLKGFDVDMAKVKANSERIAKMWELTYYHRSLRPRVAEMLEGLQSLGLQLGVISNTAAMYQVFSSLQEYGIRDYFKDVTLSSVTGLRKPCPDIFEVSLHQLQASADECFYVGDTISRDIVGSKRAGFAGAIQIYSHLTAMKDIADKYEFKPDYVVEDIYDVYPLLKKVLGK